MGEVRKPFQGVVNIIRFNWHYYAIAASVIMLLLIFRNNFNTVADALIILICGTILLSLAVSAYIYDLSGLYRLTWLNDGGLGEKQHIINISAGFDETSALLKTKFHASELIAADFYDPAKHTEVSIRRARKRYLPYPGTVKINPEQIPFADASADKIFLILAAHEIRDQQERVLFFRQLHRVLKAGGEVVVTEHLRNTANFIAYNIGALHFHSRQTWIDTFHESGFRVARETRVTPFITTFILQKNGTAN